MIRDPLEIWLNNHVEAGKAIARAGHQAGRGAPAHGAEGGEEEILRRRRAAGQAVRLRSDRPIAENELFLVEGDSAGGSAKMARNKETQAILPLRGKVLNAWEVDADRLFANAEIHDIAVALGVDPHPADAPDRPARPPALRQGRHHVRCRRRRRPHPDAAADAVLPPLPGKLIERGHVYIAQPPLYRVDVPAQGKKRPAKRLYALDEGELEAIRDRLREGRLFNPDAIEIGRFKGLGEMNPEQLRETTMDPATRRVLPVSSAARRRSEETRKMFTLLMGKGEAAGRRGWMEEKGQ
jgi:topoisomerase-4 subunit B